MRSALPSLLACLLAALPAAQKSAPGRPPLASPVPIAHFGAHPPRGEAPLTVRFEDRSFGDLTSWRWDFGDGTTSAQREPTHVYHEGGTYEVRLTVSGPDGSATVVKPRGVTVTTCTPGNARANRPAPLERGEDFVPVTGDDGAGFWCVYSGKAVSASNNSLANNVGMFVFPLADGEVLLYGSGYGDANSIVAPTESASHDVRRIDGILRFCLGLVPELTTVRFVAPHGHIDHINADCIRELRQRGYRIGEIVFHALDGAESRNLPGWTPQDQAQFRTLRNNTSLCQEELLSYASPLGRIWFHVRPGHTDGAIDLVLDTRGDPDNRLLVLGSGASFGSCPIPGVRETIEPHGNVLFSAPEPTLDALAPEHVSALGGTLVTLSGRAFAATRAGVPSVLFDGVPATAVEVLADDTLLCVAPSGVPLARGDVELVNQNGSARLVDAFRYRAWPVLQAASPSHGVETGGTRVTLSGSGFLADSAGANTVLFDGVPATGLADVSDASLSCLVPAGVVGPATITLTNSNGSVELADAFRYDPRIDVVTISPANGSSRGGLRVALHGSAFGVGAEVPQVFIGGAPATDVVRLGDARLDCTTPPGTPGAQVDVRVVAENGSDTLPAGFRYFAAPRVTAVTPASSAADGALEVTLSGSSFTRNGAGPNTVLFGGRPALAVTPVSDTALRCVVPSGTAGTRVDVLVSNANGSGQLTDGFRYHRAPTVAALEPPQGPRAGGVAVTLRGSAFDETGAGIPAVLFAGVPALDVRVLDDATLTCSVPAQAADGPVTVRVANANGAGELADGFRYVSRPTLVGLSPAEGSSRGGTRVTLHGSAFLASGAGATEVRFGGRPASAVLVLDDATLTAVTPLGAPGTDVSVQLQNANGSAHLARAFRYRELPTLTGVAPNQGPPSGGTTVLLQGSGFTMDALGVFFDGVPASAVQVHSDTSLACLTPAGARGAASVVVRGADGVAVLRDAFVYGSTRPEILTLEPAHGPAAAPGSVELHGRGFQAAGAGLNRVTFGALAAGAVEVLNDERLRCLAPSGAPGSSVDVRVVNDNGSHVLAAAFRYHRQPTLDALTPAFGSPLGGDTLTLSGSGFLIDDAGAPQLHFGAAPASAVVVHDDGRVTCNAPAGLPGAVVDVRLVNANGEAQLLAAFLYRGAPELLAVSPASVSPLGGATLTLSGSGFSSALLPSVRIGGTLAGSVVRLDDTLVTCVVPPGVAGSLADVELETENGVSLLPNALRYFAAPDLVARSPASGTALGGTTVVLTGSGFLAEVAGPNNVTFGGVPARSVTTVDDTRVRAVAPAGVPASEVDLTLTNSNGSDVLVGAFRYHAEPVLASLTPPSVPATGLVPLTLTGLGFQRDSAGTATVLFGALAASGVSVLDDQTIVCLAPAGVGGTSASVSVTNRNGTTQEAFDFRWHAAPELAAVTPGAGFSGGGTLVELSGAGFLVDVSGANSVLFGTTLASDVAVLADDRLQCRVPAGVPGAVAVTLTNGNGMSVLVDAFHYDWAPTVTGFAPAGGSALGGTLVTLTGGGFASAGAGPLSVRFGDVPASELTVLDGFHLTCRTPAGVPGSAVALSVTNNRGSSSLPGFAYHPAPTLAALTPAQGPPQGGTEVTLSGAGFQANGATTPVVFFGASLATQVTVLSDTSLTCVAPAGPSLALATVQLSNENGTATRVDAWRWVPRHPGDLDGDGRGDWVASASDGVYLFFSEALGPLDESTAAADLVLKPNLTGTDFGGQLALGDLNGDENVDIVIGAPLDDAGGTDSGSVYVFFGPLAPAPTARLASTASATFRGAATGDRFGSALAVRDVTGDGRADLVVGAPFHDQAAADAGAVFVYLGDAAFAGQTTAQAQARLLGAASQHNLGAALAAGDVDGNGVADLVLGAPGNGASGGNSGAAHVFFGGPALTHASAASAPVTIAGASSNDRLGSTVAAGDMTGDGFDELVLGAPDAKTGGNQSGAVFVVRGSATLASGSAASALAIYTGEASGDRLAQALALGDANGDGKLDLAIGAPLHDVPAANAGRAYLVLGATTLTGGTIAARAATIVMADTSSGDQLGAAVGLNELDGDGRAEFLVGSPFANASATDAGRVHLFLGTALAATRFSSADDATATGHLLSQILGRRLVGVR